MKSKIDLLTKEEKKFLLASITFCDVRGLELVNDIEALEFITAQGFVKLFLQMDMDLKRYLTEQGIEIYSSIKDKISS